MPGTRTPRRGSSVCWWPSRTARTSSSLASRRRRPPQEARGHRAGRSAEVRHRSRRARTVCTTNEDNMQSAVGVNSSLVPVRDSIPKKTDSFWIMLSPSINVLSVWM